MAAAGYGDELQHLDPVDDAPGGLQGIAAEIAGERAIVAEYFGGTPVEVHGGDVLAAALREVLKSIARIDDLDRLIDGKASEFSDYSPDAEQRLSGRPPSRSMWRSSRAASARLWKTSSAPSGNYSTMRAIGTQRALRRANSSIDCSPSATTRPFVK